MADTGARRTQAGDAMKNECLDRLCLGVARKPNKIPLNGQT